MDYECVCGAASDLGDITDHAVSKLNDPDDTLDHEIIGLDPQPPRLVAARAAKTRRDEVRARILELLDCTAAELVAAARGLG